MTNIHKWRIILAIFSNSFGFFFERVLGVSMINNDIDNNLFFTRGKTTSHSIGTNGNILIQTKEYASPVLTHNFSLIRYKELTRTHTSINQISFLEIPSAKSEEHRYNPDCSI